MAGKDISGPTCPTSFHLSFGQGRWKRLRILGGCLAILALFSLTQQLSQTSTSSPSSVSSPPIQASDATVSTTKSSRLVTSTVSKLHFRAHGFDFCHNFNNATFNLDTVLYNWKSSSPKRISELNPTVSEFASFIDTKAKDIISLIESRFPGDFEEEQTRRLACFIAAEGSNPLANLSDTRLINMIDRLAYFKEILPAIQSRSLPARIPSPQEVRNIKDRALYRHLKSDGSKRKYKLAYLLMIHGDITTMPDVRQLIEELDDGSAVFLIHVDKKSEDLKAAVIDMIASREKALKSQLKKTNGEINSWDPTDVPGNVFMSSKSYEISWGHGSLMWCQLNGFWELLDLAEWEYVINLSASDYPLRKSREIAHILSQPKYKGRNHMDSWHVNTAMAKRLLPFLHLKSPMFAEITVRHIDELGVMLPPFPRWTYVKHHQWMILTREFIEFLRTSDTVAHAFAYFEHTLIPDESFLGSVLKSFPQFKKKLSSSKRYVKWLPKQPHPEVLGLEAAEVLFAANRNATDPKYLFARKIDSQSAEGRELLDWIRREQIMNNTRNDDEYDMMEGVLFVPK